MREKFVFIPSIETQTSNLLRLAGRPLEVRDQLIAKTIEILGGHAKSGKDKETRALDTLSSNLNTRGSDNHTLLWKYEKEHLAAGEDWEAAKELLRNYTDPPGKRRIMVTDFLKSFKEFNRGTAQIEGVVDPAKQTLVKLGTVFLGDARFVDLRPQPTGLMNTVYVLGRIHGNKLIQDENHTDAHFVWLPNSNTYVRRFVTRGLNHNDLINIRDRRDLCAPVQTIAAVKREIKGGGRNQDTRHDVTEGTDLSEEQQIISHTRGWQKRYISTGVSARPVFSTRGTQFMSLYGTAVIDLAKVDLESVWDVHSPIAVGNVMGWQPEKVVTARGPSNNARSLTDEEFLALRDVLRTRELLIKFRVPFNAVNCEEDGDCILGYSMPSYGDPDRIKSTAQKWVSGWRKVIADDPLNYAGYNGRYWIFMQFANRLDRENFDRDLWLPPRWDVRVIRLKRYKMPATLDGWK